VVISSRVKGSMKKGWVVGVTWTLVLLRDCGGEKSVSLLVT